MTEPCNNALKKVSHLLVFAPMLYVLSYFSFGMHTANATLLGKVNIEFASGVAPVPIAPQIDSASSVEATSSYSLSTINGQDGESLAVNIFQGYLVLPWQPDHDAAGKKMKMLLFIGGTPGASGVLAASSTEDINCSVNFGNMSAEEAQKCLDSHRTIPVYIFGQATKGTQVNNATLSHDLLDNEHGGLFSFKATPIIFTGATRENPYGSTIFIDAGAKYIQAPTPNPQVVSNVYAGYLGLAFNYELPTVGTLNKSGSKNRVAGDVAVGFGAYRNKVSGIDSTLFAANAPNYFTSYVGGMEVQLPGNFSLSVYRAITKNATPFGDYTAMSLRQNF